MMFMTNPNVPSKEDTVYTLCKQEKLLNSSSVESIVDQLEDWVLDEDTKIDKTLYSNRHASYNVQNLRNFVVNLPTPKRFKKSMSAIETTKYWSERFDIVVERSYRTVVQSVATFSSMEELKQWFSDNNGIEACRMVTKASETTPFMYNIKVYLSVDQTGFSCIGGPYDKPIEINLDNWFIFETSTHFHLSIADKFKALQVENAAKYEAECEARRAASMEEERIKAERKAKRAAKKVNHEAVTLAEASK